jgi:hypothetical protein
MNYRFRIKADWLIVSLMAVTFVTACGGGGGGGDGDGDEIPQTSPFRYTSDMDPDIITAADPTAYLGIVSTGQANRTMYDRRVDDWITVNAYLFEATYFEGFVVEVQVNPEFGSQAAALVEAEKYAEVIGRIPTALRMDVETVWIHKGFEAFGGGNNNILIHVDAAEYEMERGRLEETMLHEGAHASLDTAHALAPGWLAAQSADGRFISTYAEDNPDTEDIAESIVAYVAVRYRSDRISEPLEEFIWLFMPNRLDYFDSLGLAMYPIQ